MYVNVFEILSVLVLLVYVFNCGLCDRFISKFKLDACSNIKVINTALTYKTQVFNYNDASIAAVDKTKRISTKNKP